MSTKTIGTDINQIQIKSLSHIKGQAHVINTLKINLRAYFNIKSTSGSENLSFGPVALVGPSGTGKTVVAKALHTELKNKKLIETNGVTLNKKEELYSVLINSDSNTTLFIDEAQGMRTDAQHILLTAISEKHLYISAGVSSIRGNTISLADFTLIIATTHEYLLQDALRDRMRIYCRFNHYSVKDLIEIVRQRANLLNWQYESDDVLRIISKRAKGIPRLALNVNLQTCWHVAKSYRRDVIMLEDVKEAFDHLQIDEFGLDKLDRTYLALLSAYDSVPLNVLSSKLSLPARTIQRVLEPYLIKNGLIIKDKSSLRILTDKGRRHINNFQ
jgi:Holliday junction DNA helicase RuvB